MLCKAVHFHFKNQKLSTHTTFSAVFPSNSLRQFHRRQVVAAAHILCCNVENIPKKSTFLTLPETVRKATRKDEPWSTLNFMGCQINK